MYATGLLDRGSRKPGRIYRAQGAPTRLSGTPGGEDPAHGAHATDLASQHEVARLVQRNPGPWQVGLLGLPGAGSTAIDGLQVPREVHPDRLA